LVEQPGAEILQLPRRIRKCLLETITPDKNMPDHLSFEGLKRTFALGIQRGGIRHGIRPSLGDGIAEELEDIVVPQPPGPMGSAVFDLAKDTQMQPATADQRHKPYHGTLPQVLIGSNDLNGMKINGLI
jgi:hypothetical protein